MHEGSHLAGLVRRWGVRRWLPLLLLACTRSRGDEPPRPSPGKAPIAVDASATAAATATGDPIASAAAAAAAHEGPHASDEAGATVGAHAAAMTEHRVVLHVGDSTVGYHLGLQLELSRMFKAAGIRYESRTVTSAGLHSFATEKILEKAVRETDPDLVIIQVGTNNLTVPHPDVYITDLRSIVRQANGRDCYWIGPISIDRPEKGMRAVIRTHVEPCTFFDSFDLELARQPDDFHPTQPAAKKWAEAFWAFATTNPPGR
jgi:lysophospholipase L1-like esterase